MTYFLALFLVLLQSPARTAQNDLPTLVKGIETSFARMRDMSADFVQIYQDSLNRKYQESGHLYLMKPQRMRWEYKSPEEKLFVSNGKTVYFYVPADKQVSQEPVREALDDRIPLMFLVGRSNLSNEFTRFETLSTPPVVPGARVLRMFPKRKSDLQEIIMEADPSTFQIRRLRLTHSDGSHSEFIFTNVKVNTGLQSSLFDFKVPPGVQVVEGIAP